MGSKIPDTNIERMRIEFRDTGKEIEMQFTAWPADGKAEIIRHELVTPTMVMAMREIVRVFQSSIEHIEIHESEIEATRNATGQGRRRATSRQGERVGSR